MQIAIQVNLTRTHAFDVTAQVIRQLDALGAAVLMERDMLPTFGGFPVRFLDAEQAWQECDLFIAIGGDGTFIHAAHDAARYDKEILGINAGSLGFLAGLEKMELPLLRHLIDGNYEIDLVLRNNRTTEEYPLGIFHPHAKLHHIKKENIGLIEVMGLAILPARLLGEMELLKNTILSGKDVKEVPELAAHAAWAEEFLGLYPELQPAQIQAKAASASEYERGQLEAKIDQIIKDQIGIVFAQVLEHAGVYKDDDKGRGGFDRFVASLQ